MPEELGVRLATFARRTMRILPHCGSEDATRIYLVMPILELLGYDARDPTIIVPGYNGGIDLAIMIDGVPAIAIAISASTDPVEDCRARLIANWAQSETLKLAIATNGVVFEAYVDSEVPRVLDREPFVRFDAAAAIGTGIDALTLSYFELLQAGRFDPVTLTGTVFEQRLRERLQERVLAEFRHPSEAMCRLLLGQAGINGVGEAIIDERYRAILKSAMEQAIVVPVVQALRLLPPPAAATHKPHPAAAQAEESDGRGMTAARLAEELVAFGRARRRSA